MSDITQGDFSAAPALPTSQPTWHVALDVGGSGSRLVAEQVHVSEPERIQLEGRPVRILPTGSDAADVVASLCRSFTAWAARTGQPGDPAREGRPHVAAAAVGVTGLTSLVPSPGELHDVLARELVTNRTAVAGDALTAHLGALRGRAGAVLAVGTGAVAFSFDRSGRWHRADGWGHLLGDLGAGVWIGGEALRAATAAHDGRPRGGSKRLLDAALARLGPVPSWPAQLYLSADRATKLASFTPEVMLAAQEGDEISQQILHEAGKHLATTLATALAPGIPGLASTTGRLVQEESPLTRSLAQHLAEERPEVALVPSAGTPLDGALNLARKLATEPTAVIGYRPWLTVRIDGRGTAGGPADLGADTLVAELSATELPIAATDPLRLPDAPATVRFPRPVRRTGEAS